LYTWVAVKLLGWNNISLDWLCTTLLTKVLVNLTVFILYISFLYYSAVYAWLKHIEKEPKEERSEPEVLEQYTPYTKEEKTFHQLLSERGGAARRIIGPAVSRVQKYISSSDSSRNFLPLCAFLVLLLLPLSIYCTRNTCVVAALSAAELWFSSVSSAVVLLREAVARVATAAT
jgi:hypothetical protein